MILTSFELLNSAKETFSSSFFWLDPKEPKGQDTAKLQPHKAGHWPAAVSPPRAHLI